MKSITKKEIKVNLVKEYSFSPDVEELGEHSSSLELWEYDNGDYSIEWNIPSVNECISIGIFCHDRGSEDAGRKKVLSGYDGIFSLPQVVIEFLEENGFDCEYVK